MDFRSRQSAPSGKRIPGLDPAPVLHSPALDNEAWLRSAFLTRSPGIDVSADRETALARLAPHHARLREVLGFSRTLITAEQVHGNTVALVTGAAPASHPGADALITNVPSVCLGIYVADCAAIFLADPVHRAIGLVHSGKNGTASEILPTAIAAMRATFGTVPSDLVVEISPCIRPPRYETDFAADLRAQATACGVAHLHDSGVCTGSDLKQFYSYRIESGRTGRMLALLEILKQR
jgi:copper oxidase (laccase) domain-containing protein